MGSVFSCYSLHDSSPCRSWGAGGGQVARPRTVAKRRKSRRRRETRIEMRRDAMPAASPVPAPRLRVSPASGRGVSAKAVEAGRRTHEGRHRSHSKRPTTRPMRMPMRGACRVPAVARLLGSEHASERARRRRTSSSTLMHYIRPGGVSSLDPTRSLHTPTAAASAATSAALLPLPYSCHLSCCCCCRLRGRVRCVGMRAPTPDRGESPRTCASPAANRRDGRRP